MNEHFRNTILKATEAKDFFEIEVIQSLWSGYGKIIRLGLVEGNTTSVVVKHVSLPTVEKHPRGWNSNISHTRKIKSYQVETAFYQHWAAFCDEKSRIPTCMAIEFFGDEVLMVLEDLDLAGYEARITEVSWNEIELCLQWLANFHATFLEEKPKHLWEQGTYWHLETRPEELEVLADENLKRAANSIDQKLNETAYQTFVHGDAKLANFCFKSDGTGVAAVDFQYVGGGCGMKDVAYFIGSCLDESDCEKYEKELLDFYFKELKKGMAHKNKKINFEYIEMDWRELYPVAWADFHRFLKGWSPGHWKINSYSERLCKLVIDTYNF